MDANEQAKREYEEREKAVWDKYRENPSLENRNELVKFYGPLVNHIAGRVAIGKPPNVEFEDLVSYGVLGLMDAIEKFDFEKKVKFKTYANVRIRGAIMDELRSYDWIPRTIRNKAKQIQTAYIEMESRLGRLATDEEVCQYLNVSLEEFNKTLNEISGTTQLSLDETWKIGKDFDEVSIIDTIEAPNSLNPEKILAREEIKKEIIETVNCLPDQERLVLALYYYENLTLKEIGHVLELTESRVSQIHSKAISILKARMVERLNYKF